MENVGWLDALTGRATTAASGYGEIDDEGDDRVQREHRGSAARAPEAGPTESKNGVRHVSVA